MFRMTFGGCNKRWMSWIQRNLSKKIHFRQKNIDLEGDTIEIFSLILIMQYIRVDVISQGGAFCDKHTTVKKKLKNLYVSLQIIASHHTTCNMFLITTRLQLHPFPNLHLSAIIHRSIHSVKVTWKWHEPYLFLRQCYMITSIIIFV